MIIFAGMKLVSNFMSVLNSNVTTLTWMPRSQRTSFPHDNLTLISTHVSLENITASLVKIFSHFNWHKLGILNHGTMRFLTNQIKVREIFFFYQAATLNNFNYC